MFWYYKKISDFIRNRVIQSEEIWILCTVQSFHHRIISPVNNFLTEVPIFRFQLKIFSAFFTWKISNRVIILVLFNFTSTHWTKDVFFSPVLCHDANFLWGTCIVFYQFKIESIHVLFLKYRTSSEKWLKIVTKFRWEKLFKLFDKLSLTSDPFYKGASFYDILMSSEEFFCFCLIRQAHIFTPRLHNPEIEREFFGENRKCHRHKSIIYIPDLSQSKTPPFIVRLLEYFTNYLFHLFSSSSSPSGASGSKSSSPSRSSRKLDWKPGLACSSWIFFSSSWE